MSNIGSSLIPSQVLVTFQNYKRRVKSVLSLKAIFCYLNNVHFHQTIFSATRSEAINESRRELTSLYDSYSLFSKINYPLFKSFNSYLKKNNGSENRYAKLFIILS